MVNSGKIKLAAAMVLSVLLFTCMVQAKDTANDSLDTVIAGVAHSDSLIANISFDYVVDYNTSDEWRIKRLEFTKKYMCNNCPEEMELRVPTLERTSCTGSTIFEGDKFKITSKWSFLSDQEVFADDVIACDGVKLTELDRKGNAARISNEVDRKRGVRTPDPRNFPMRFVDSEPLHSALTAPDTNTTVLGTEEIEGTFCYVIEMVEKFVTPEGVQKQSSRRCWIAPNRGFLVKKAISYGTKSFDSKPLTVTQCELTEVTKGIWYYSKVTFESYPLSLPKPDVIEVLKLKNIVVNQEFKENAFTITFPIDYFIDDEVTGRKYRVGEN